MFGLLLVPKDYIYFANVHADHAGIYDISIAVVINILIMVGMSVMIMINGVKNRLCDLHMGNHIVLEDVRADIK